MRNVIFIILAWYFNAVAVSAAPFVNLDFEAANTNSSQMEERFFFPGGLLIFGTGSAADLFPGWTVIVDGHPTNVVAIGNGYYGWPNPFSIPGHVALAISDHVALAIPGAYVTPFLGGPGEGKYSLRMDNSRAGGNFY